MKNLHSPKWLLIINTIPLGILFFLFWNEYTVIHTLLDEVSIALWKKFSLVLAVLGLLNFAYVIFLIFKKKKISFLYGLIALVIYIPFLYLYGYNVEKMIPFSIPRWMISGNMFLYVGTFLMPTLIYSLFILVTSITSEKKEYKAWKNFLIAIGIPISWYVFGQLILPLWKPIDRLFNTHTILIFVIIGTLLFLFFLIRGIYILILKKAPFWKKHQLAWKIPISIILPLLGLTVNNGKLFNTFGQFNTGIFGNFNNNWFYVLAVINGIFICLPDLKNKTYRFLLLIGRSITFAYTFYFFLVFLPFLPFSVLAVIAVGTGFLMLTPLLLFVIHINEISHDIVFLKSYFSKKWLSVISFISFLVIPLVITLTYVKDRNVLNETLSYLYSPNYSKKYTIDKVSLSKTLSVIKGHKDRNRGDLFGGQIPYLSSYFNWLVLDNLTLSDAKINTIENVFFQYTPFDARHDNIRNENVEISKIQSKSRYNETQDAWVSWVDLEITNKNTSEWAIEYATTIELPEGCWISDYYLFVGDKKEMGILAEKKAAKWVFSQIRNENRDPGILYYLTGTKVAFRVFPFTKNEVRKTGIEFIHKNPIQLQIDGHTVELGNTTEQQSITVTANNSKNVLYVSAEEKMKLNKVQRTPYYHFLVDASIAADSLKTDYILRIEQLLEKNYISTKNAKISFVNTYTTTFDLDENWKKRIEKQSFDGGFYLDRAIKKTLIHSYTKGINSYPIMVVVTDSLYKAILSKDFADLAFTFPESELFYKVNKNGKLEQKSLLATDTDVSKDSLKRMFDNEVLAYPNAENPIAYLADNAKASIVLKDDLFTIDESQIQEKNWHTGLLMQGKRMSQMLHPENESKEWLQQVKYSFLSKIMTPVTSYLVVENEAQKAMLKKKQEQVLSGNKNLDLGEEPQRMSEPSLWLLTLLLGFVFWLRKRVIHV